MFTGECLFTNGVVPCSEFGSSPRNELTTIARKKKVQARDCFALGPDLRGRLVSRSAADEWPVSNGTNDFSITDDTYVQTSTRHTGPSGLGRPDIGVDLTAPRALLPPD